MMPLPDYVRQAAESRKTGLPDYVASAVKKQAAPKEPGFLDAVIEDLGDRSENISNMFERQTAGGVASDILNAPKIGAMAVGQVAGGLADVAVEGMHGAYKTLTPDELQSSINKQIDELADPELNKLDGQALMPDKIGALVTKLGFQALQAGGGAYEKFKSSYPDAALALEGIANIAGLGGGKKAASKVVGKVSDSMVTPTRLNKQYSATVKRGIDKSIRPGVEGKRTFSQAKKYYESADRAVNTIIGNQNELRLTDDLGNVVSGLPKNLRQFSQATDQTKRVIFKKYDDLAKSAGEKGVMVDLKPISQELETIIASQPLQDNAPNIVKYAQERAEALAKRGSYTTEQAQEAVKILNNSLESFYKNPSYDTASRAYVDSLIVNNMRKGLDNVIESATSPGYQELKRDYGALKAIERDVNRRTIVDARKNARGLVDFSDIFSGERAITGLLTLNPSMVGQAASVKGMAKLIKMANDPNRAVKNLFQKAEKITSNPKFKATK